MEITASNSGVTCSVHWGILRQNETGLENQCPPIWDGLSCWGPAASGEILSSRCPSFKGSDVTKSAFRACGQDGQWLDRDGIPSSVGWTNYTACLTPEIREIMRRLGSNEDTQLKLSIASNTRILEFVGLSFSFAALLLSLLIFYYFRSLRNSRTRLHRHLFIAMVIQVAIRLIVYTDQAITRNIDVAINSSQRSLDEISTRRGIDNTPILCEASYISLEYARTAMFMWMFVEGLFLHNMITVTVFEEKLSPFVYPVIGWIIPVPLTVAWATITHLHYGSATCWWGYNFTLYFWILEGPRLAVLMINLAFLLNILRVLILKLRQSKSSETQQALKAVKAALVLLPLLGLTNLLNMMDAPLEKSPFQFALWSYSTHVLTSTQGLVLAFLYCFRNGEVQLALRKFVRVRILGSSKHTVLTKRSIPMTALDNASIFPANSGKVSQSAHYGQRTMTKASTRSDHINLYHHSSSRNEVIMSRKSIHKIPTYLRISQSTGALQKSKVTMDTRSTNNQHPNHGVNFFSDSKCPLLIKRTTTDNQDLLLPSLVNCQRISSSKTAPCEETICKNNGKSDTKDCSSFMVEQPPFQWQSSEQSSSIKTDLRNSTHVSSWRMLIIPDLLLRSTPGKENYGEHNIQATEKQKRRRTISEIVKDYEFPHGEEKLFDVSDSDDSGPNENSLDFVSIEINQDICSFSKFNHSSKPCKIYEGE